MAVRYKSLDGLRGIAALMVVIAHYFGETPHGSEHLKFGWVGVEIFFVLSGFLIGSIVFAEQGRPNFIASFYLRRAARIVPVYLLTVAACLAAAALLAGHTWIDRPFPALWYLGFVQNMAPLFTGHEDGVWLRPLWTLACEEQFYLILPALICLLPRRWIAPVLLCWWAVGLPYRLLTAPGPASYYPLISRSDLFIAGVLAAWAHRRVDLKRWMLPIRIAPIVALIAAGLIGRLGTTPLLVWAQPFFGIGAAAFILGQANGAGDWSAALSVPVLRFFGRISYALYLIHQPVAALLHGLLLGARPDIGGASRWEVTFLAFAVSIGLATLSWFCLENPIITRTKQLLASARPTRSERPGRVLAGT